MYNGIGLQTARGSGTNGYVQSNKFFIKAKANSVSLQPPSASIADPGAKKANKEILEHDRKRRIELRLVVLEETLADQGYTQAEIAEKLRETRAALETAPLDNPPEKRISDTQTHQIAARKEKQLETFRAALGIKLGDESPKPDTEEQRHQDKAQGLETEESGGEKDREQTKLTDGKQDHGDRERENSKNARATEEHKSKDDLHDKKNREKKANEVEHKKMETKKGRYKDVSASDSSGEDVKNDKMKPLRNTRGLDSRYDTDIRSSKKSSKVSEKDKISSYLDSNEDSDSSSESGGERTRKSRKVAKQRKYDSDSGTDGDNKRKRGNVKERPSSWRRYDHDKSDSGHDSGRENTRKSNKYVKQRRRYDNESKIDEDAKKKKGHARELPSRRRHDSDSDFSMDETRKSRKVVKKQRRYDSSSSETDEDDGRKKAHVNETSRKRRHDSGDSDSDSDDSGIGKGRTSKHYNDKRNKNDSETVQEKRITNNKKILEKSRRHDSEDSSSGADDSESHSSDSISDGDSSDASDSSGYKRMDAKNGKRLKSIVEKDMSSGISRRDDQRTSKITNEDRNRDHSSLLKKSEKNRHVEMKNDRKEVGDKENQAAQGKWKIDDGRDDLPVLESRNSGLGKSEKMKESVEAKKDRYNRDHRSHHERRDNQKRDDYKYHGNSQKHYDEDDYGRRHKSMDDRSRDDRSHTDPKRRKLESSRQYARSNRYDSDSGEDLKSHRQR
ncbi:dentin sialophosphoprotein-like [Dioscorea cayenensis subsp. rotundata]|uniref:Dentin sialophosphoprotein-like n=1 Tax=Dioscorea cayennensis subsp. rotundata TaxID=55577 RepID=A0AB40B537_DIOCR|nr:dentin sialophosphoprotein-like [Dioscorea cayenensis subsp. rotundata]